MSLKPDYQREGVRLYLGDCKRILPHLGRFDATVMDPPYGIGEARNNNASRSCMAKSKDYGRSDWDDRPLDNETMSLCISLATNSIVFGGNYYPLPPSSCWLVWDKLNGNNDFADCELAWTNLKKAVRRIQYRWHGMIRDGEDEKVHPTQKPVDVMRWCIGHLPERAKLICDPTMGSGTTGVAAVRMYREFVGIEKDADHFAKAAERIDAEFDRAPLFASQSAEVQSELFGDAK